MPDSLPIGTSYELSGTPVMAGASGNNGRIVYEDLVYNRWVGVLLAMGRWRAYRGSVNRIHAAYAVLVSSFTDETLSPNIELHSCLRQISATTF